MTLEWLRRDNNLKDHALLGMEHFGTEAPSVMYERSEERRVGKECRSRWSPYH